MKKPKATSLKIAKSGKRNVNLTTAGTPRLSAQAKTAETMLGRAKKGTVG